MPTVSTTPKPAYVYDSITDTWYPVGSVALANMRTYEYFATQGQTSFSGNDANLVSLTYIPGNIVVYLNGLALSPGDDYTATNGTSIVLVRAASLNDVLTITTFSGFHLSDTYTRTEINASLAAKADKTQLQQRNIAHNGAFQVHQRTTSSTGITAGGYYTADRWNINVTSLGTWTQDIQTDAPTGSGFRKSIRMLCTTADGSPAAGDLLQIGQTIEGQDVQRIAKGTPSAKSITVSFWVKSNVTGTYVAELVDLDNTRQVSAQYTIFSSGTWEREVITFPADLIGVFDNDNAGSLRLNLWLGAGSTYTSGIINTAWAATTDANRAVGQVNLAATANNYWQVTGVQIETGTEATPFEFKTFGQELAECQRYYEKSYDIGVNPGSVTGTHVGSVYYNNNNATFNTFFTVPVAFNAYKRAAPTVTLYSPSTGASGKVQINTVGNPDATGGAATSTCQGFSGGITAGPGGGSLMAFNWVASIDL